MKLLGILNRFKEPSTMAGLAVLLSVFGVPVDIAGLLTENAGSIIAGVLGLAAVFIPENKGPVESVNVKQFLRQIKHG